MCENAFSKLKLVFVIFYRLLLFISLEIWLISAMTITSFRILWRNSYILKCICCFNIFLFLDCLFWLKRNGLKLRMDKFLWWWLMFSWFVIVVDGEFGLELVGWLFCMAVDELWLIIDERFCWIPIGVWIFYKIEHKWSEEFLNWI